ncbi:GIY-YIG nuclease family protein [candidate division WWE3 bacterium]|uniref:GIY-YIG nuclease family protein n=1 Tax=candidate division WWE3 bacterium TaxID=2053526 RepID=A0A955RQY4_UNCKA|nr:GIY-YIG nuclease family protein [candidate division WWE3 bacterium]
MFYTYVLENPKDWSLYIGYTNNLSRRIREHRRGQSEYTSTRGPYKLICYFAMENERDAKKFEKYLKSGYGRRFLKSMLKNYLSNS